MMILYTFFIIIASYFVLDPLIVLDRTDQALGDYDFVRSSPDAEVLIEGTGKQQISDDQVFTTLKIIRINWNKTPLALDEGSMIEAKEYFVVYRNLSIMGSQWIPGRSLFGMGTDYVHVKKGERRTLYLAFNPETNKLLILPSNLVSR
ncbi:hypothetical protein QUF95_12580 [Paenibacillus silvae]|jgi:hypothetical protein|uniref:hypothetical protein n=1 Tax=Paenibacillus silvae TaxID=1325358 RepID=UPI0025A148C6|nr:hypothetical protein [Paenibacillus silvae]MDM5278228.1 hypothetical protein [Paenibacillus silvae]